MKRVKSKRVEWVDTMYGYTANAKSKMAAWMLIRNKCHEMKLEVPTVDQIKLKEDL